MVTKPTGKLQSMRSERGSVTEVGGADNRMPQCKSANGNWCMYLVTRPEDPEFFDCGCKFDVPGDMAQCMTRVVHDLQRRVAELESRERKR